MFRPSYDNMFVEIIEGEKTPGGIILPPTSEGNIVKGIVRRIGKCTVTKDGKTVNHCEIMGIKEGSIVWFLKHAGVEVAYGNERYRVVKPLDVYCIADPEEDKKD